MRITIPICSMLNNLNLGLLIFWNKYAYRWWTYFVAAYPRHWPKWWKKISGSKTKFRDQKWKMYEDMCVVTPLLVGVTLWQLSRLRDKCRIQIYIEIWGVLTSIKPYSWVEWFWKCVGISMKILKELLVLYITIWTNKMYTLFGSSLYRSLYALLVVILTSDFVRSL